MVLVFYTSAHGFGHASRDIEVINEIGRRRPDARIVLRAAVPRWFVEASVRVPIALQPLEADTGIVQIDSLRLDEDETARTAARFYADFDARADEEAAILRRLPASVVVGDIPPLAFEAAHRAGVRSVALGNFTWDWIYEGYSSFDRLAPGVIPTIRTAYAHATCALRLPLHGGFDQMTQVIEDIPLIARRSALGREEARRALGLRLEETVVLASFGAYGLSLDHAQIERASRFRLIAPGHHTTSGLRYEDLVAASDVVVSKPGYGIVSECIANGAALLYTSRGPFREHDVFVAEMPKILRCRYIPQQDLHGGRWDAAIAALLAQPDPAEPVATHGAVRAADAILATAERRTCGDRL
jgi:L-arabinokinase